MKKAIAIIPARYASTRFPGKPLVKIGAKTMVELVYEQASKCVLVNDVVVATDNERIKNAVLAFGGQVVMTSEACQSGTDRCAEVIFKYESNEDIIVNVQGDEPYIQPEQIQELILLMQNESIQIGTLAKRITEMEPVFNPNVVKVVRSLNGKALLFSRNPIPFVRGKEQKEWLRNAEFYKHIGLYAYKKSILKEVSNLPIGKLELAENLEQLRWLEAGYEIFVAETEYESIGIDTPEDLEKVIKLQPLPNQHS
jgi:3-deoxy-manno-octulosonate cytidylyltransferase (CMP-KDO synthetase)